MKAPEPRIACYAGSFDPCSRGHADLIQRASHQYDRLHVLVAENPTKTCMFTIQERLNLLSAVILGNAEMAGNVWIEVLPAGTLLVDYAKAKQAKTLIRGLRAVSDFDMEFQMALANRALNSTIETVFIPAQHQHMFISSTIVRGLASCGADLSSFVPPVVETALKAKFAILKGKT